MGRPKSDVPSSRERRWVVPANGTLLDVLATLERGKLHIAVATEPDGRVVGIMTDGDARRALLGGASLDSPVEPILRRNFTSVEPTVGRAEVLDLMRARRIEIVPIVDANGFLRGMHHIHEVLGVDERPNWAVIMAGGRGVRLGSLTDQVPKPMIRVAGRPILERLVLHLVGFGLRRIFLTINYLGHVIEEHFGDGSRFGCSIEYIREDKPLGTAGSLALLPETPAHPLLVVNGDLVTQANIGGMIDFHQSRAAIATLAVHPYFHTVPFGCVTIEDHRVTAMEEKPQIAKVINAGIYVIDPSLLRAIPRDEQATMPGLLAAALERGDEVSAFELTEDWIDVGQREQLQQARGHVR